MLLLLEHPPVYTRGRRSEPGELPMGEAWYRAQGIDVVETDRGGKLTYHGPGQLVGYPIVRDRRRRRATCATMERAIVAALAEEGIDGARPRRRGPDYTGVWVRGPQDRLDRRARLARRLDARLRRQRRQRPRSRSSGSCRAGCDGVRDDVGRRGAGAPAPASCRASADRDGARVRDGVRPRASGSSSPRSELGARAAYPRSVMTEPRPRHSTRSRANPGGMDVLEVLGPDVRPFRERKPPWFKVPAARRPEATAS